MMRMPTSLLCGLSVILLGLNLFGIARADENIGDDSPSGTSSSTLIESLFDHWISDGFANGTMKAQHPGFTTVSIKSGDSARISLRATKAFGVMTNSPLLGKYDGWPVLQEIYDGANNSCSDFNGSIKREPLTTGFATFETREMRDIVYMSKFFGEFTCLDNQGSKIFVIQISPFGKEARSFTPPGWKMQVNASLVGYSDIRASENLHETFRLGLKPGESLSVSAADVPSNAMPKLIQGARLNKTQYMVCGMAVEIRDQLIQVQVDQALFFVPKNKVYPPREKIGSNPKGVNGFNACY